MNELVEEREDEVEIYGIMAALALSTNPRTQEVIKAFCSPDMWGVQLMTGPTGKVFKLRKA